MPASSAAFFNSWVQWKGTDASSYTSNTDFFHLAWWDFWEPKLLNPKSLTIVSCDHEEQQYLDPIFSQLSDYIYAQKHSLKKLVSFETWIAKRKALDEVYDSDASMWEELGQAAWDNE